jgi:TrmH family RNA methyltransferase
MSRFVAVLVDPLRPANVGAAARALKNFGGELRVVGGAHALPGGEGHAEARALAWNASDVLDAAGRFESLEGAIADCALSAAASSRADDAGTLTPRALAAEAARLPDGVRVACVFGPEDSGLTNDQLDACRARVRIPTRDAQPSLNLAQAVVVVAYEMACAVPAAATSPVPEPASEEALTRLWEAFQGLGLDTGFLNAQAPQHVLGEIRSLVARARPSEREVTLLLGLVAQLRWATRRRP